MRPVISLRRRWAEDDDDVAAGYDDDEEELADEALPTGNTRRPGSQRPGPQAPRRDR